MSFGAVTFEREFEHWMRRAAGYLGFTEEQITTVVRHATALHEKRVKK
jgi:hypothetical protein